MNRDTATVRTVAPKPSGPVRCLAILSGPNAGEVVQLRSRTVIGRRPDADFRPADRGVSREHAVISVEGDKVKVTDLGSRNGTFIAGHRITRRQLLDGDQFTIGQTTFLLFSHAEEPSWLRLGIGGPGVRDASTGLYTRRFFLDRLQQDLDISTHRRRSLTVSLFEIDNFSDLSAAHEAQRVNECVAAVARRLSASIRVEDLVARYDEHQFAILYAGVNVSAGRRVAARCAKLVSVSSLVRAAPLLKVKLLVGTVDADCGDSAQQIMWAAEAALGKTRQNDGR